MDELIDIFDENGNFLKTEMKSIAHRDGLWHKSIHGFLINDKKEILLQLRASTKELYPSKWDMSFSGHVSAGENTLTSAIRECNEEIGLSLEKDDFELLFTFKEQLKYNKIISNEFVDVYLCRANFDESNLKKQDSEVDGLKLVSLNTYIEMIEANDPSLVPHYDEYKMMAEILKKL